MLTDHSSSLPVSNSKKNSTRLYYIITTRLEEGPPCNTEVELNPVRPVKDVSRGSDPFLDQAAMTAYGAVLKIIDEEFISTGGESTALVLDETVTDFKEIQRDSKMKSFHFRSFPVNNIWSDTVSRDWNF